MFSLSLPKWVIAAVAAAALVLGAVGYAISEPAPHSLRTFATEAGLPTDFEIVYEVAASEPEFNAWFTTGGQVCMMFFFCMEVPPHVYVSAPATWPREWVLAALFHEIGHYHQYRTGRAPDEWDADEYAARHLCSIGLNGPELVAGMLSQITYLVKIESPRHGNHYRRIDNVRSRGCNGRGLSTTEAP